MTALTGKHQQVLRLFTGIGFTLILQLYHLSAAAQQAYSFPKVANTQTPLGESTQRLNNTPKKIVALTPPMGWNSWNNFGLQITEQEFKRQVDYVAEKLRAFGYEYMVIDASWYSPSVSADKKSEFHHSSYAKHDAELDSYGRWLPARNKFPGSNGSFKSLADYVHAKGLKFGLHMQRGIPWQAVENDLPVLGSDVKARDIANPADVCLWFNASYGIDMSKRGAQEYYNSVFKLYASWGVDFVKVDDISMPYHADEITAVRKAIEASGRNMVFSTSPGSTPVTARYHILNNADMFRVSSDFWDTWPQLKQQFDFAKTWAVHAREVPGRWPDLDMLPIGKIGTRSGDAGGERFTRFTHDEQYTLFTLWCIARSPLIVSNDLLQNDDFTLKLITNKDVLEVSKMGSGQHQLSSEKGIVIWESKQQNSRNRYIAFFNVQEKSDTVNFGIKTLDILGKYIIRDLWKSKGMDVTNDTINITIPPHGAVLYKIIVDEK